MAKQIPPPPARSKSSAMGTSYAAEVADTNILAEKNTFLGLAPIPHAFNLSFQFSPPALSANLRKLKYNTKTLDMFYPAYYSLTYGTGGNLQTNIFNTIQLLQQYTTTSLTPHISCVHSTPESIMQFIHLYKQANIQRLVVLHGDKPADMAKPGYFHYAKDLIEFIRKETTDHFWIEVAAYPECHPEAPSPDANIQYLKAKMAAGANSAITQYFYNIDSYNYFLDECEKQQVNIPIVPGIMPILNYTKLKHFSDHYGIEIPHWLKLRLAQYADNLGDLKKFGVEIVTDLAQRLLDQNAPSLHFFTLNNTGTTLAICQQLSWKK